MLAEAKEESDEALVARMKSGDERALGTIVRRHGPRLRALALRFAGGAEAADDILQETFVTAWRTAMSWQIGGPPYAAWLTRIAVNRAIDWDRKRKLRRFFGLDAGTEVADPATAADDALAGRTELAAVIRDLAGLPARQRAAILLSAEGERSNAEIAAALRLTEGATEQLLVRARRTLRTKLAARNRERDDDR